MADSSSDSEFQSLTGGEFTPSPSGSVSSAQLRKSLQYPDDRSETNATPPEQVAENKQAECDLAQRVCLSRCSHYNYYLTEEMCTRPIGLSCSELAVRGCVVEFRCRCCRLSRRSTGCQWEHHLPQISSHRHDEIVAAQRKPVTLPPHRPTLRNPTGRDQNLWTVALESWRS